MDDDLNTAQALAVIFDWVRELNTARAEGKILEDDRSAALSVMEKMNEVLVLWRPPQDNPDEKIRQLIEERNQARKARNFALSDKIREQILEMGYIIEDTKDGVRWKKY
jgi:cysteinyl-tRNA synthetase